MNCIGALIATWLNAPIVIYSVLDRISREDAKVF